MKISPLTVFVWCLAISMIIITYGLAQRQPVLISIQNYKKYGEQEEQEQKNWIKAVQKVQHAHDLGVQKVNEWNAIAATHTLPAPPDPLGIDLSVDGYRLAWVISDYRNRLQAAVNNQVKAGGVTVVQGPVVPLPPLEGDKIVSSYFNYPASPTPVLVFNLGNVTVSGTYQQISDNVKAWRNMPHFLAVADGLRLQGTSPKLTGTYAVTLVGFVKVPADKAIFPPLPEGGRLLTVPIPTAAGITPPAGGAGTPPANAVPGPGAAKGAPAKQAAGGPAKAAPVAGAGKPGAKVVPGPAAGGAKGARVVPGPKAGG